eukprot:gene29482-36544_t
MFLPFGGAFDVAIIKQAFFCKQSGYGFINFDAESDALKAVHTIGITVTNGVQYVCSLSNKGQSDSGHTSGSSSCGLSIRTDSTDSFDHHSHYSQDSSPRHHQWVQSPSSVQQSSNMEQHNMLHHLQSFNPLPPPGYYEQQAAQSAQQTQGMCGVNHVPQFSQATSQEEYNYQAQMYLQHFNAKLQQYYMQYQPQQMYCNQWNRPAVGQHFMLPPPRSTAAQQHVQLMYGVTVPLTPPPSPVSQHTRYAPPLLPQIPHVCNSVTEQTMKRYPNKHYSHSNSHESSPEQKVCM